MEEEKGGEEEKRKRTKRKKKQCEEGRGKSVNQRTEKKPLRKKEQKNIKIQTLFEKRQRCLIC